MSHQQYKMHIKTHYLSVVSLVNSAAVRHPVRHEVFL